MKVPGHLLQIKIGQNLNHGLSAHARLEDIAPLLLQLAILRCTEQRKRLNFEKAGCNLVVTENQLDFERFILQSESTGISGRVTIDLSRQTIDSRGSVVPMRQFNSYLGSLPFIGILFSKGEGFLAADFTVKGSLSDPSIKVDALSTITPDALQSLFSGD